MPFLKQSEYIRLFPIKTLLSLGYTQYSNIIRR